GKYLGHAFLFRHLIYTDVDDDGAFANVFAADETRAADRRDQYLRTARHLSKVLCPRMTDSDRRVFLQKQRRHRLADDVAAAENNGFFSGDLDTGTFQHFD